MYPVGKILKPRLKYFVKNTFQDENRRIDEYKPFESNVKNVFFSDSKRSGHDYF